MSGLPAAAGVFRRVFVLGGARSGKSRFAEQLAAQLGEPVVYVATAIASDDEMRDRIQRHKRQRPAQWRTIEEPVNLAARLSTDAADARTLLIEDLTLLLANAFAERSSQTLALGVFQAAEAAEQVACHEVDAMFGIQAHVILVSNEVGMGLVPHTPVGRAFRDCLGRVNQYAANAADSSLFIVAGRALRLDRAADHGLLGPNHHSFGAAQD